MMFLWQQASFKQEYVNQNNTGIFAFYSGILFCGAIQHAYVPVKWIQEWGAYQLVKEKYQTAVDFTLCNRIGSVENAFSGVGTGYFSIFYFSIDYSGLQSNETS